MKCWQIEKLFLLYMDDELSSKLREQIQSHLNQCKKCELNFSAFRSFISSSSTDDTVSAPQFLWEKLYHRIERHENRRGQFPGFLEFLPRVVAAAAIVIIMVAAFMLGVYLGDYPITLSENIEDPTVVTKLAEETLIDSFDDFPPLSLGDLYLSLKNE
ncbi:MAG TPA: zf-HC2 domain-containing protein [bacterium]|nr:zf-HC2 domain-containing protein [bacterium]